MTVLTLAGLWNSGPQHWQTHWESKHGWTRAPHREWETPDREEWVRELDEAIAACPQPPVLAAHSLSCTLVTWWAARHGASAAQKIAGAFLVAPSDVDAPSYPDCTTGFQPIQLAPLPFPSIVVASENDIYVSTARARQFAAAWGSELHLIGDAGHINGDAGYGPWPEGEELLLGFVRRTRPACSDN